MAATDQFYRSQRTLDVVFGVSCILLLLSTFWMMYDDHVKPWKAIQREFRDVETVLYTKAMLDRLPAGRIEALEEASGKLKARHDELKQVENQYEEEIRAAKVEKARADTKFQDVKANYDSIVSHYNIAVELRDKADEARRPKLEQDVEALRKRRDELQKELDAASTAVEEAARILAGKEAPVKERDRALARELAPELRALGFSVPPDGALDSLSQLEDVIKKETSEFDRLAKLAALKNWKGGDRFRALPIIDAFASPFKIQQVALPDLTIEYGSFKHVPRYDRCQTCHLGIDRPTFDARSLRALADAPEDAQAKLTEAINFFNKRRQLQQDIGFDPDDLPTTYEPKSLEEWQVKQYAAHPRLDLFIEANSPHPVERFGCTSCHAGQGSATDFNLASHTPNDAVQQAVWTKAKSKDNPDGHSWAANHYWDFPMLPRRFVESSCVKCHHEMTDLIRYGDKQEAPKLLRGYNLVKELGCFGCHEISGTKSGKPVGPDLRVEPWPALDELSPEERTKMLADKDNPPGTMRKVGPSLRRISEKTTELWTRKWLNSPSGFRPDTRMPHFYNLSTNRPDLLPADQKNFPAAEIHAAAYYLFKESRAYLAGTDTYRRINEERLKKLEAKPEKTEKDHKEIAALKRRLELYPKPEPLGRQVVDANGRPVNVPPPPADEAARQRAAAAGRTLFTERGCLACHAHEGTEKAEGNIAAVTGDAAFGPNLSRIAAKIGTAGQSREDGRRWLIQWVLNPNVHHPRTRMPITHLTGEEAAQVAEWLLSQNNDGVKQWLAEPDVQEPDIKTYVDLARVYLSKVSAVNPLDLDGFLAIEGNGIKGLDPARVPALADDADEQVLVTRPGQTIGADTLKYYLGKKTVNRLGCFGCHDIPGFEGAKPIGTPLNDWGKKDPERLAFEDIAAYVKDTYHLVDRRDDAEWKVVNGKRPYEKFFADAIGGHKREGFLHQKLMDPRSYDYHRDLKWDDRLRMPQFTFTHPKRAPNESPEAFEARKEREEAEAREAVMTFVLGLVAEPMHASYLNRPGPDRLAEIKGRQVLDKFNCAGCHQIRPGVFEFRGSEETKKLLNLWHDTSFKEGLKSDHVFKTHNAWNVPMPAGDTWTAFGVAPLTRPPLDRERRALQLPRDTKQKVVSIRLTNAFAFPDVKGQPQVFPAGTQLNIFEDQITAQASSLGGTFAQLMLPYMARKEDKFKLDETGDSAEARAYLPPTLVREGEKVQPEWLFTFLRDPTVIRPLTILRMPKFNMSEEDARALVNYFAGVDRSANPGIGLTYPYTTVPERSETYWQDQARKYWERIGGEKGLEARAKRLAGELEAAQRKVNDAKDPASKQEAEREVVILQASLKALSELSGKPEAATTLYWHDGYRLIATTGKSICLDCHQAGAVKAKEQIGPPLELSFARLRPDWTERWIANPNRLLTYPSKMPQNLENNKQVFQDLFEGTSREQVQAATDVLMNFPKVADLPVNRSYRAATTGGK